MLYPIVFGQQLLTFFAGRTIYEWEQDLTDVNIFVTPPPGVRAKQIDCVITPTRIRLGLKGNPPFLNVSAQGA